MNDAELLQAVVDRLIDKANPFPDELRHQLVIAAYSESDFSIEDVIGELYERSAYKEDIDHEDLSRLMGIVVHHLFKNYARPRSRS